MENAKNILYCAGRGLLDSVTGIVVLKDIDRKLEERSRNSKSSQKQRSSTIDSPTRRPQNDEPTIIKQIARCCAFNGSVTLLVVGIFDFIILPILNYLIDSEGNIWVSWLLFLLRLVFISVYLIPALIVTKVCNFCWFQNIADKAFKYSNGRKQALSSWSKALADNALSLWVEIFFAIQAQAIRSIPIFFVSDFVYFIHMCFLNSLYVFEYKWYNMGWEFHRRVTFLERNWAYFVGFGIPLTLLSQISTYYVFNCTAQAIAFSFFIVSANQATPVTDRCDFPLKLFPLVIAASDIFFKKCFKRAGLLNNIKQS